MLKKIFVIATMASVVTLGVSHIAGADNNSGARSVAVLGRTQTQALTPAPASDAVRTTYSDLAPDGSPQDIPGVTSGRVWVQTTAKGACLRFQQPGDLGPGVSCSGPETMAAGNAWNITGSPSVGFRLVAFVPNGAETASITLADGTERTVAVVRNAIMLESKVNVSSYSYTINGSAHTIPASGVNEG
jgi:hypothetical protein